MRGWETESTSLCASCLVCGVKFAQSVQQESFRSVICGQTLDGFGNTSSVSSNYLRVIRKANAGVLDDLVIFVEGFVGNAKNVVSSKFLFSL